ncbi:MAG: heme ABC exporter ATP-binding protein CcmA [Hyphomicrobiales bacterium]|nr:heme ABC exporter ATP-binding protein CcmA [Hyphomicrobiales bacterium]
MRLIAENLACIRGGRTVFEGLSLDVAAGEGLVLRGPNGAGKTSLLRTLAGFIPPAAGRIALDGGAEDTPVGEQAHYVGHLNGVKRALTVSENLAFWASYLGGGAIEESLERLNLWALRDIPAGLLSAGQGRRLGLARLHLVPRPVWFLDEPSVSLDAASQTLLAGLIEGHVRGGGLVLAATHVPLGLELARELVLGQGGRPA